jgi:oligopeptide transport system ATP-binding protein
MPAPAAPPAPDPAAGPLLDVRDLVKHYPVRGGLLHRTVAAVRAVDGVSFAIRAGETLGLVGESGCGKTTVGRTLLRLVPATSGSVSFQGRDVFALGGAELKRLRRDMQIIFQDPYSSLDPRMPVGEIVGEGLLVHGIGSRAEREERVRETMARVGLRGQFARRYPHEFSGGQRQRIGIARALVLRPQLVVCDEPVSALDVSIQAQILNLLRARPRHPYTRALLSAIPEPDPTRRARRIVLTGDVPSPVNPPPGCRFHTRCPVAHQMCREVVPPLAEADPDHRAACHAVAGPHQDAYRTSPPLSTSVHPAA